MRKVCRNESCVCGSGKKFKHCCINKSVKGVKRTPAQRVSSYKGARKVEEVTETQYPPSKGDKGGRCNVSHCLSDIDVNYCNEWNGNTYYCLNCAIDFTDHDNEWTQGYRFNSFVPHPLLCNYRELKWFIEKGNTFTHPVREDHGEYQVLIDDEWYTIDDEDYRWLLVTEGDLAQSATLLTRPVINRGNHSIEIDFYESSDEGYSKYDKVFMFKDKEYRVNHDGSAYKILNSFILDKSTKELSHIKYR